MRQHSARRSISCLVLPIRRHAFFEQTVFQGQIATFAARLPSC